MFTRLRWFLLGVVATVGATVYVIGKGRAIRERLTARAVLADALELTGRALRPGS